MASPEGCVVKIPTLPTADHRRRRRNGPCPSPTPDKGPVATPTIDYNTLAGRYPLPLKVEYADEQTYLSSNRTAPGALEDESFDIDQTAVAAQGTWIPL